MNIEHPTQALATKNVPNVQALHVADVPRSLSAWQAVQLGMILLHDAQLLPLSFLKLPLLQVSQVLLIALHEIQLRTNRSQVTHVLLAARKVLVRH